ncbi:MAG: hypothetical protein GIKADHBN_02740 [Phycisphaerales bacterium]|nr:hypothetical protein [Phycisphaerales bacterium]
MSENQPLLRIAASVLVAASLLSGCGQATSDAGPQTSPGLLPPPEPDNLGLAGAAASAEFDEPPAPRRDRMTDPSRQDASESPLRITRSAPTDPASPAPADEQPAQVTSAGGERTVEAMPTLAEQIAAKAAELRRLLQENASMSAPLSDSLAVAALDAFVSPSSKPQQVDASGLSPAEQAVERAARDVFGGLSAQARRGADPARTADLLFAAADGMSAQIPVRISYAGLCRRVESFGSYEPFESTAFLAGRSHRAIVYVELDRFSSRTSQATDSGGPPAGRWVAEVSQELELIHNADGRQQWYRPAQTVVDTSRTRRRDFYLVNTIDLPATLSVGAYSLKVTIRDKNSGASDERVIPLEIIADSSASLSPRASAK